MFLPNVCVMSSDRKSPWLSDGVIPETLPRLVNEL